MHHHLEVILPKGTNYIAAAIESVMRAFDENRSEDEEDYDSRHAFWDFYVIGGRFAGNKQLAKYDKQRINEFHKWCEDEKITISNFVAGKQELSPASQIPKVDAKWNEMFPSPSGVAVQCPLFKHSNDQYGNDGNGTIDGDISRLGDSLDVTCSRVIFAGPSFVYDRDAGTGERTGPLEAVFMLADTAWNGVNHMDIAWNKTIGDALRQFKEKLSCYAEEYRLRMTPGDDWIAVTVDYHS
jgi:hypothetical protein